VNLLFIHDKFDETVQIMDDELDSSEHCEVMNQFEFFESYAGYHMGTDDVTISDLIKQEYLMHINCQSDLRATNETVQLLKAGDNFKPVSFKDIAYQNFN